MNETGRDRVQTRSKVARLFEISIYNTRQKANASKKKVPSPSAIEAGVLFCVCLIGESQNGCGEFLKLGRRILNSIGVIMAANIP